MTVRNLLAASMTGILLCLAVQPLYASGKMTTYATKYTSGYTPKAVYKSVDSSGKITYSTTRPDNTVIIEEIAIKPGPAEEYVEDARQRQDKIREAAVELTEAREKREADREAEEKKRLERLALQRSARPQVYERRVYVGWNPLWRSYPHRGHHHGQYPHKKPSRPLHRPGLSPWRH